MKKLFALLGLFIVVVSLAGCDGTNQSSDVIQKQKTEQIMKEVSAQVGMPAIANFQEKKLAKMIFELRDREKFLTTTYIVDLNGKLHKLCDSIGYGLPYSVQYTNPSKIVGYHKEKRVIPQADPNGLFMPQGLSATWVMCVDDKGEPTPVYVEPNIIVSPFNIKK